MPLTRPLVVLQPHRLRRVPKSFAWIDRRLRQDGFLASLNPDETTLYVFLALAADRDGLSCWRLDRMERELSLDVGALGRARAGLVRKDLLGFRPWSSRSADGTYQLLSIPTRAEPQERRGQVGTIGDIVGGLDESRRW